MRVDIQSQIEFRLCRLHFPFISHSLILIYQKNVPPSFLLCSPQNMKMKRDTKGVWARRKTTVVFRINSHIFKATNEEIEILCVSLLLAFVRCPEPKIEDDEKERFMSK